MPETILMIFEGEKAEVKIYEKLYTNYFSTDSNTIIISSYNTNIYKLWKELYKDEYLDIVEVIREKNEQNRIKLNGIDRDQIAQVYLFFDHDAHDPDASNEIIESMLHFYQEETDHGKLYISYPMVEALKDFSIDVKYKNKMYPIARNIEYKKFVNKKTIFQDLRKIFKKDWNYIIGENLKKGNFITTGNYSIIPFKDLHKICQINIFKMQKIKYIEPQQMVSVLSGFPFFIAEYFGEDHYVF
jgi:hypothetical protein